MREIELKELVRLFWGISSGVKRDQVILSVVHYMRGLGVGFDVWGKVERLLIEDGLFKKGGYMDIREHIKAEGIKEGRQEGWQKGQQELILKMLEAKAELSLISKVTGLSSQEIKKLKNGSKK